MLAFEATRLCHGQEAAESARRAAEVLFGSATDASAAPGTALSRPDLEAGIPATRLFVRAGLCRSRSEAARIIAQGGARINDRPMRDVHLVVNGDWVRDGRLRLQAGRRRRAWLRVVEGL